MEKKIAIRGHKTRGRDVIRALEGMGGTNDIGFDGSDSNYAYYIRHDYMISLEKLDKPPLGESYSLYTIEEYEAYMKNLEAKCSGASAEVAQTMEAITDCADKNLEDDALKQYEVPTGSIKIWDLPNGYIFKDENGNVINATKTVLEKKEKEYPKTYEECRDYIESCYDEPFCAGFIATGYKSKLIDSFTRLLICRDAYWKIAGEEMGLGRPWEPDYDSGVDKFGIICLNGVVQESNPTTNWERHLNKVLEFPTKEMRDAFKENFDPDIEICKELL